MKKRNLASKHKSKRIMIETLNKVMGKIDQEKFFKLSLKQKKKIRRDAQEQVAKMLSKRLLG